MVRTRTAHKVRSAFHRLVRWADSPWAARQPSRSFKPKFETLDVRELMAGSLRTCLQSKSAVFWR